MNQKTQHSVQEVNAPIALGVIGIQKRALTTDYFEVTSIPNISKIRVRATTQEFTKKTYAKYSKQHLDNKFNITYIDSLENKPSYLNFQFLDRVNLVSTLLENENVVNYLKTQNEASIVSEVSMVVTKNQLQEITNADALFLKNNSTKECILELHTDNKLTGSFKFNDGAVLGYRLANFCWGTNDKNQQTLFDIIPEGTSCPKNTNKCYKKEKEQNLKSFTRL